MITMNTGLTLRAPLESDYNAYRRFLVANRFMTNNDITYALKKYYPESHILRRPYTGPYPLIKKYEQDYCHDHGIDYEEPHSIDAKSTLRNCPLCAKHCYHSYLFQLKWITHCPIHHVPLTKSCQDCHNPWPKQGDLLKRHCSTCSANIPIKELTQLDAITTRSPSSDMEALNHAVGAYKEILKNIIETSETRRRYYDEYPASHIELPYIPGLIECLYPNMKSAFKRNGVRSCKCYIKEYHLRSINKKSKDRLNNTKSLYRIYRKVELRILRKIRKYFKDTSKKNIQTLYFPNTIKTKEDLLRVSYLIWKSIMEDHQTDHRMISKLYGSEYFQTPIYIKMPRRPSLSQQAFYQPSKDGHSVISSSTRPSLALPDSLREWLYEFDLWRLYIIILKYLKFTQYASEKKLSWSDFYAEIPQQAHPDYWESYRYILYRKSTHRILVMVPNDLLIFPTEEILG